MRKRKKQVFHIKKTGRHLAKLLMVAVILMNGFSSMAADSTGTAGTEISAESGAETRSMDSTEGGDQGGTEGGDQGGTEGGDQGGTEGGDQGGTEGGDQGGTEGGDQGGTEGGGQGGTEGGGQGGTEGGGQGGTEGTQEELTQEAAEGEEEKQEGEEKLEGEEKQEGEEKEENNDTTPIGIDGLYYHLNKDTMTASVYGGNAARITGVIDVPAEVTISSSGNTYRVNRVDDNAFYGLGFDIDIEVRLPDSIESIGNYAFYQVAATGTLRIPDSVTSMGYYSFNYCKFDEVILGSGMSYVPYGFLKDNAVPVDVELNGDTLQGIGTYAFANTTVRRLTVTGSNPSALDNALAGNEALKGFVSEDIIKIGNLIYKIEDGEASVTGYTENYAENSIRVPSTIEKDGTTYPVTSVADDGLKGADLKGAPVFGEGMKHIGKRAYAGVRTLTYPLEVKFPESLEVIDEEAFRDNEFDQVSFGKNTREIGAKAFANVNGSYIRSGGKNTLKLIFQHNPDAGLQIAADAFEGCNLNGVYVYGPRGCMDEIFANVPELKGATISYFDNEDHRAQNRVYEAQTADQVRVRAIVTWPGNLSDDTELVVTRVTKETAGYSYQAYLDALNRNKSLITLDESIPFTEENTIFYDIAFIGSTIDEEGHYIGTEKAELQPGSVSLQFQFDARQLSDQLKIENEDDVLALHLPVSDSAKTDTTITRDLTTLTADDIRTEKIRLSQIAYVSNDYVAFSLDGLSIVSFTGKKAFDPGSLGEKTLQQRIDEAGEDGIVVIDENTPVDETAVIPAGKKITLTTPDGSELITVLGDEGIYPLIKVEKGAGLVIDGNLNFASQKDRAKTSLIDNYGTLTLTEGKLQGGSIAGDEGAAVRVRDGATFAMTGGSVENTTATGKLRLTAPVRVEAGGSFAMSGGEIKNNSILPTGFDQFVNSAGRTVNSDPVSPGGVLLYGRSGKTASMTLSGGTLSGNSAYAGGAIMSVGLTNLQMTGGVISGNSAQTHGGGIAIAGPVLGGGNSDAVFVMNGGTVSGNTAKRTGGGIYINTSAAMLKGGRIENNKTNGHGGGVYVSTVPHVLQLENVLITGNRASSQGGGVWLCPTGAARFFADHGVAIFDNTAGKAANDFASNGGSGKQMEVHLDRRMLGGGLVFYYQDGGFHPSSDLTASGIAAPRTDAPRFDASNPGNVVDTSGTKQDLALHAVASGAAKEAARNSAKLVITGNEASQGGGIGSNGSMRITGDEPEYFTLNVIKKWENVSAEKMPERIVIELLLQDIDNDVWQVADTVELTAENNWQGSFRNILSTEKGHIQVREQGAESGEFLVTYGEIVEDGQQLSVEITNTLPSDPVKTDTSVRFTATKYVNNANPGGRVFTFTLSDAGGNVLQTKNNSGAQITFDEIIFDKAGTYTYTIREVAGNEAYVTYDATVYTATVTVTESKDAVGNITLSQTTAWRRGNAGYTGANPVFNNSYNPPPENPPPENPPPNNPPPNNPPPNNPPPENPPQETPPPDLPDVLGVRRLRQTDGEAVLGARRGVTGESPLLHRYLIMFSGFIGLGFLYKREEE